MVQGILRVQVEEVRTEFRVCSCQGKGGLANCFLRVVTRLPKANRPDLTFWLSCFGSYFVKGTKGDRLLFQAVRLQVRQAPGLWTLEVEVRGVLVRVPEKTTHMENLRHWGFLIGKLTHRPPTTQEFATLCQMFVSKCTKRPFCCSSTWPLPLSSNRQNSTSFETRGMFLYQTRCC